MVLIFDGCTQFCGFSWNYRKSSPCASEKNIRRDILKLTAQNSAFVKVHNKKLRTDMVFFRLGTFGL